MSWSFGGEADTSKGSWSKEILTTDVALSEETEGLEEAQSDQVRWAKETVIDAIDCNVVGHSGDTFTYYVNGHANPDHKPRSGWANDIVTITVAFKSETPRV